MKTVQILYNPNAGNARHDKDDLIDIVKNLGLEPNYINTKKVSEIVIDEEAEFILLAGGDGTVRKLAKALLERKVTAKKIPIALFPLGTANNIASMLNLNNDPVELFKNYQSAEVKHYDCGVIRGLKEANFFLEGTGLGVFPKLIHEMKKMETKEDAKDEKKKRALQTLIEITETFDPIKIKLLMDGIKIKGEFCF